MTTFVGRQRELESVRRRMVEARLVTVVGPGGVGKTRLAVASAHEARPAFDGRIWMVDLAPVADLTAVAQTFVSALGIRDQSTAAPEDKLIAALGDTRALLLVDNCEHLLSACAELLARLLTRAPDLHILATSREALGIAGEQLYPLEPLSAPDPRFPPSVTAAPDFEAVSLFVDRATSVVPDFRLTEANVAAVSRICAALDGLPLALELAATRLRSLGVTEVSDRLDDRFALLNRGRRDAAPRQQTLHALISWSFELCTPAEQLLWTRLSVFAGTFDLDAAQDVCQDEELSPTAILDTLDQLVAKSIVTAASDEHRCRYRMLVTIRDYGAERLPCSSRLRRRHRDHFLNRAQRMAETWCGPGQAAALGLIAADHPNLHAALDFSLAEPNEAGAGARLAAALRFHWVVGGRLADGRRWLDLALERLDPDAPERGPVLWACAWVALVQGDHGHARTLLAECGRLADDLDDPALRAHTDHWLALSDLFAGALPRSVERFERAITGHRSVGDLSAALLSTFQLVAALAYAGRFAEARTAGESAIATCDERGERWSRAYLLWTRGLVAWRAGDLVAAEAAAVEALREQGDFHDGINMALTTELLAWVAAADGRTEVGLRRLGAARAVWKAIGTGIDAFGPGMSGDSHRTEAALADLLGGSQFAEQLDRASAFSLEAALDIALGHDPGGAAPEPNPLSRREREVAALVAQGLTNRQIAETLILSPRTIDGHLERIFSKLAISTRAALATWATGQGLTTVG